VNYICDNTPSYMGRLIDMWGNTHSHVERDAFTKEPYVLTCGKYSFFYITLQLHLHDSFAEYRLFCRALLHKRPIILRSLLIVATLYSFVYRAPH